MNTTKYKILYIDDEQDNLDVFESTFWKEYDLSLAISAEEGFDILSKENIQLIITDQRMPVMTGIEFLEKIKDKYPDAIRIVLTGNSDLDTVIEAINKGEIYHYLTKPWQKEEVKKTIEKALETFRLKEENRILLEKLHVSNQELEELNKSLEDKVSSRTSELNDKNIKLSETISQLGNAQTQLVKSEKLASLGMLSSAIGHEINNPIGAIKGGLTLVKMSIDYVFPVINALQSLNFDNSDEVEKLKEKLNSKEFEERKNDIVDLTNIAYDGVERTIEIISSLKYFVGSREEGLQEVNIHNGLDSTILLLRSKLVKANIEVLKNYDSAMEPIKCLPGLLNQVFMNLLVNAIDAIEEHSPEVGKIEIITDKKDGFVRIMIKDNGIGMSEKVLKNVFETFFTTKDQGKGTGLGMSISKDIIDQHKGKIDIKSDVGKGTMFTISLPM